MAVSQSRPLVISTTVYTNTTNHKDQKPKTTIATIDYRL